MLKKLGKRYYEFNFGAGRWFPLAADIAGAKIASNDMVMISKGHELFDSFIMYGSHKDENVYFLVNDSSNAEETDNVTETVSETSAAPEVAPVAVAVKKTFKIERIGKETFEFGVGDEVLVFMGHSRFEKAIVSGLPKSSGDISIKIGNWKTKMFYGYIYPANYLA